MAQHVMGYSRTDSIMVGKYFRQLPSSIIRETLLYDYIEELTADVLGMDEVYGFFLYCFNGQKYRLTQKGTELHQQLWERYI